MFETFAGGARRVLVPNINCLKRSAEVLVTEVGYKAITGSPVCFVKLLIRVAVAIPGRKADSRRTSNNVRGEPGSENVV